MEEERTIDEETEKRLARLEKEGWSMMKEDLLPDSQRAQKSMMDALESAYRAGFQDGAKTHALLLRLKAPRQVREEEMGEEKA